LIWRVARPPRDFSELGACLPQAPMSPFLYSPVNSNKWYPYGVGPNGGQDGGRSVSHPPLEESS